MSASPSHRGTVRTVKGRQACATTVSKLMYARCQRSCETVEQTAARRATDPSRSTTSVRTLKRLNRPRPNGLQTVVVQGGVEVVCITTGNYHVEPQSCWLVLLRIHQNMPFQAKIQFFSGPPVNPAPHSKPSLLDLPVCPPEYQPNLCLLYIG